MNHRHLQSFLTFLTESRPGNATGRGPPVKLTSKHQATALVNQRDTDEKTVADETRCGTSRLDLEMDRYRRQDSWRLPGSKCGEARGKAPWWLLPGKQVQWKEMQRGRHDEENEEHVSSPSPPPLPDDPWMEHCWRVHSQMMRSIKRYV